MCTCGIGIHTINEWKLLDIESGYLRESKRNMILFCFKKRINDIFGYFPLSCWGKLVFSFPVYANLKFLFLLEIDDEAHFQLSVAEIMTVK